MFSAAFQPLSDYLEYHKTPPPSSSGLHKWDCMKHTGKYMLREGTFSKVKSYLSDG
jgi:hypothetical protein